MTPEEDKSLRMLLNVLEGAMKYGPLTQERNNEWVAQPRSAFAGDDAKTHPHDVSHAAWHALTVAVDHLQCLRSSLVQEVKGRSVSTTIHTHAQFSLVRGALENASRAVWLIDPASRVERITRRLGMQAKEYQRNEHLRELADAPITKTRQERIDGIIRLLEAAGLAPADAKKAVKDPLSYKEIVREAGASTQFGSDALEVAWSACSSLAHGDSTGTLNFLDREVIESEGGISLIQVTGSISMLAQTTYAAVKMTDAGFRLFKQRATAYV